MVDAFQQFNLNQAAAVNDNGSGGKGEQSFPLLKVLGISDSKVGTLGALSSEGWAGKQTDSMGLFRETWLSKVIKGGFAGGQGQGGGGGGGGATEISAPTPTWASRSGGGDSGGVSLG